MSLRILFYIAISFFTFSANGQLHRKELSTDTGVVVLHYFKDGKSISTKEWIDVDDRWGMAWAYSAEGKEIYQREIRRIAGHASVHFSYHANGGVAKAEYSSAPDAGIQWHRDYTGFDENGNQTSYSEDGHDNYDLYPRPNYTIQPYLETIKPTVPEKNPEECQVMFSNRALVVNQTKFACRLRVKVKHPSPLFKDGEYTLAPGDTVQIGTYSFGEIFQAPDAACELDFERITLKKKGKRFKAVTRTEEVGLNSNERQYFVEVGGWKRR
jgi:hypothetical protein